jgi:hypothetical protein
MNRDNLLFAQSDLRSVIELHGAAITKEVEGAPANQLLNTSVDDFADYLVDKYRLDAPRLREDEIAADQEETKIDVSQDPMRFITDRSQPFYINATRVSIHVPFDGDPDLFKYQPSTFTWNPPRGRVVGGQLILAFVSMDHNAEAIQQQLQAELSRFRQYLGWVEHDVTPFNDGLRDRARGAIEMRRQKLLKDQGLVAALGFPLIRREDAPKTYTTPAVRRKVKLQRPAANTAPFVPEPALDMNEYDHILSVIRNMVAVMERSPKAFKGMGEEDLRQHFLVQLNGQYDGQATGETFNYEGKTDILIRVEGRNIFIAECKYWRGAKVLAATIDQLLGYTTWRDTKTALLIFNRSKNFSAVVNQVPEVIRAHSNFKRELPYEGETGFRCVMGHRDDPSRDLIVTTLAFDVPA